MGLKLGVAKPDRPVQDRRRYFFFDCAFFSA
jgi:hypothetical protein